MFFWDTVNASVKGIDFFCSPKAYLNLLDGISMYDTWGARPYINKTITWYLSHPAFAVFVSSWLSCFKPWAAYWLWIIISVVIVFISGIIMSSCVEKPVQKGIVLLTSSISIPMFWTLYVGNSHAVIILSFACLFAGMIKLQGKKNGTGSKLVFGGILLSLFSKPVVVIMLPLFLIIRKTRKVTSIALLIYSIVSILFIIVPILNPESIGLGGIVRLLGNIGYVKTNMNIYANNFVLTPEMKCNSIHWFNLAAQAGHNFSHIDIFSLASFVNDLSGKELAPIYFKIPLYVALAVTLLFFLLEESKQIIAAIPVLILLVCSYFLSYNTVWEYQYSAMMPVFSTVLILFFNGYRSRRIILIVYITLFLPMAFPSLYFLVRNMESSILQMFCIRITRVVPVAMIYLLTLVLFIRRQIKDHITT